MIEVNALIAVIKDPAIMGVVVYVVMSVRNMNKHLQRHCIVLDRLWTEIEKKAAKV